MIGVSKITNAAQAFDYYKDKDDYYLDDKMAAEWYGKGAAALGLAGEIDPRDFRDVLAGTYGGAASQNPERHTPGWDVTFSAPKSVSVAALVDGDRRVIDAWDQAVRKGLDYLEEHAAITRQRGADGDYDYRNTNSLVIGAVRHATNRNLDPQLHTHAVVANMTPDPATGKFRSLDSRQGLYKHQIAANNIVMNDLAASMRGLGYDVADWNVRGNDAVSFDIGGVPPNLRDEFSSRKREIDAELAARGTSRGEASAAAREAATLDTRSPKEHVPAAELRKQWRDRARAIGYEPGARPAPSAAMEPRECGAAAAEAVKAATDHLAERATRFTSDAVMEQARIVSQGRARDEDLKKAIEQARDRGELIDRTTLQDAPGNRKAIVDGFTTSEGVRIEQAMLRHADRIAAAGAGKPRIGERTVGENSEARTDAAIREQEARSGYAFTDEQRAAVHGILGSESGLHIIQGYAGTAKTTSVLATVAEQARAGGWKVKALAPTNSAATTLGDAIGVAAGSIASEIHQQRPDAGYTGPAPTGEVWIVDEAGMASAQDKEALLAKAERAGARVILVGDEKQIGSVGAGAAFEQIKDAHPAATYGLTEIKRQTSQQLREAVYDAIKGDSKAALDKVEVHEHKGSDAAIAAVADDYMRHAAAGKEVMAITLSRDDRDGVNAEVQRRREAGGEVIDARSVKTLRDKQWTDAQRADAARYKPGDVIEAQRDFRGGPKKGETAIVIGVEGGKVRVQRADGRDWTLDPKRTDKFAVLDQGETRMGAGDKIVAKGAIAAGGEKGQPVEIKNGTDMTVDRVRPDGRIDVHFGKDQRATIDARNGVRADLGYAQTANQAQGRTVDVAIADMRSTQRRLADQQRMYVALSRAREKAIVHTDNKAKLAETLGGNTGRKETAIGDGRRAPSADRHGQERKMPQVTPTRAGDLAKPARAPRHRLGSTLMSGIKAGVRKAADAVRDYRAGAPERRDRAFLDDKQYRIRADIDKRMLAAEKRIKKAYGTNPKAGRIRQALETGRKAQGRKILNQIYDRHDQAVYKLDLAVKRAEIRQMAREARREQVGTAQQDRQEVQRAAQQAQRRGESYSGEIQTRYAKERQQRHAKYAAEADQARRDLAAGGRRASPEERAQLADEQKRLAAKSQHETKGQQHQPRGERGGQDTTRTARDVQPSNGDRRQEQESAATGTSAKATRPENDGAATGKRGRDPARGDGGSPALDAKRHDVAAEPKTTNATAKNAQAQNEPRRLGDLAERHAQEGRRTTGTEGRAPEQRDAAQMQARDGRGRKQDGEPQRMTSKDQHEARGQSAGQGQQPKKADDQQQDRKVDNASKPNQAGAGPEQRPAPATAPQPSPASHAARPQPANDRGPELR